MATMLSISIDFNIWTFCFQGNLKEEIKQLQAVEQQVKNRVTEFTQKKEDFSVRSDPMLTLSMQRS